MSEMEKQEEMKEETSETNETQDVEETGNRSRHILPLGSCPRVLPEN